MNVAHGDNAAFLQIQRALWTYKSNRSASGNISGFPDRRLYPQCSCIRSGNLHLCLFSDRTENAYILNGTKLKSYNGNLLVRRELAAHQVFLFGQLISLSEEHLYVLLRQVDMSGRYAYWNQKAFRLRLALGLINCLHYHPGNAFYL